MRCTGVIALTGWLVLLAPPALAQRAAVVPVDEAIGDPEFFVFRARLQAALATQDTAEVLKIVAPDIRNSFGGDGGRDEFREQWNLAQPEHSSLWGVLALVLALGGRFHGDSAFYAPYTFEGTPGDGFEALAVLGRSVLIRAEPSTAAAIVDTVSFEAVTRWREGPSSHRDTEGWEPVRTSKNRTGWVSSRFVRSPIDYRAGFLRQHGRWWLQLLVAGD